MRVSRVFAKAGKAIIYLLLTIGGAIGAAGIGILLGVEFKEDVHTAAAALYLASWAVWGIGAAKIREMFYGP